MTTWRFISQAPVLLILLNSFQVETVQKVAVKECQDEVDCLVLGHMHPLCLNSRCVDSQSFFKKPGARMEDLVKPRKSTTDLNERPLVGESLFGREGTLARRAGSSVKSCKETRDCELEGLSGYTCLHSKCICEVEKRFIESVQYGKRDRFLDLLKGIMADSAYSKCHETVSPEMVLWGLAGGLQYQSNGLPKAKTYGDKCKADYECSVNDGDLVCKKTEPRRCRCKRGLVWDSIGFRCFMGDEHPPYDGYLDPVRQMILPGVVLITLGAMIYLGFKLFCNCGRRGMRRAPDMESSHLVPNPATWVASYRVLSPVNGTEVRTTHTQPLQPGLLVPDGPPTYEEALTHKVIFSSYNPTTNQAHPL
ncbi:uncharacterized protein LOC111057613 isoform X2 [Nilaparvata lugens]|uniref:uncharacterized protein LOC111057613 isoform X2 n=1 Tax=Nilaparvata lugens TaxID=108931 RepID=UPI000B98B0A6|nr:uncharacterized protein LOC111057613 isoform X2 [Nilaparvata lugens]